MAGTNRLTAKQVEATKGRTRLADGGGLFLQVTTWKGVVSRSWEFRFTLNGRTRSMGVGAFPILSLKAAREEAEALRKIVREGSDPIEDRKAKKLAAQVTAERSLTFAEALDKFMATPGFGKTKAGGEWNAKHRKQWRSALDLHAGPVLGHLNVAYITMQDVLRALEPIWATKNETATRLRGRIEAVFAWATVAGYRTGDNPARWEGNLKHMLGGSTVVAPTNQPAVSLADLPKWFAELRKREGYAARALEFAVLTAARSGEVRGAVWSELDLDAGLWTIPASRMKMKKKHTVPLPEEAVKLLRALPRMDGTDFVFPAAQGGMLSDMALSAVMRRMHEAETKAERKGWLDEDSGRAAVPHGLRSTFRGWTAKIGYERDMAEMALAHNVANDVERRYQRHDMVERRRAMMAAWAKACHGTRAADNVAQFPKAS